MTQNVFLGNFEVRGEAQPSWKQVRDAQRAEHEGESCKLVSGEAYMCVRNWSMR